MYFFWNNWPNSVSPKDVEYFYLKLILHRLRGATYFEDFKIHEHVTYITFEETAIAVGLVERDKVILNIFDEACTMYVNKMPTELLYLFA